MPLDDGGEGSFIAVGDVAVQQRSIALARVRFQTRGNSADVMQKGV